MNETSPVRIECPACAGRGCESCGDAGEISVTTCPLDYADRRTWTLLELTDLYERGLPPVAGGALDQATTFIEAARFVRAEQTRHKAELGLP